MKNLDRAALYTCVADGVWPLEGDKVSDGVMAASIRSLPTDIKWFRHDMSRAGLRCRLTDGAVTHRTPVRTPAGSRTRHLSAWLLTSKSVFAVPADLQQLQHLSMRRLRLRRCHGDATQQRGVADMLLHLICQFAERACTLAFNSGENYAARIYTGRMRWTCVAHTRCRSADERMHGRHTALLHQLGVLLLSPRPSLPAKLHAFWK